MSVVCITDEIVARRRELATRRALVRALADDFERKQARRAAPNQTLPPARVPPSEVAWSRDAQVDFRPYARSQFEIRLGYAGLERVRSELGWGAQEGVEVGGFLWAHQRARYGGVIVAHVSPPAEGSRHSRTGIRLGQPEDIEAAWPEWLRRSDLCVVGDWHSHPNGDGTPSRTDYENWSERVRRSGGSQWASVIVTRGRDGMGWLDPQLRGWVTSSDGSGGYVCEPAKVAHP